MANDRPERVYISPLCMAPKALIEGKASENIAMDFILMLLDAGIDNWEGYDEVCREFDKKHHIK
jgi:hypothetical protein